VKARPVGHSNDYPAVLGGITLTSNGVYVAILLKVPQSSTCSKSGLKLYDSSHDIHYSRPYVSLQKIVAGWEFRQQNHRQLELDDGRILEVKANPVVLFGRAGFHFATDVKSLSSNPTASGAIETTTSASTPRDGADDFGHKMDIGPSFRINDT